MNSELSKRTIVEVQYGCAVYGGAIGLMGKLADTVIEHGGKIKGIMP